MIHIESLPDTFVPPGEPFETIRLPMIALDRTRVRRRVLAPDGVELALALPTGTRLWPGGRFFFPAKARSMWSTRRRRTCW